MCEIRPEVNFDVDIAPEMLPRCSRPCVRSCGVSIAETEGRGWDVVEMLWDVVEMLQCGLVAAANRRVCACFELAPCLNPTSRNDVAPATGPPTVDADRSRYIRDHAIPGCVAQRCWKVRLRRGRARRTRSDRRRIQ